MPSYPDYTEALKLEKMKVQEAEEKIKEAETKVKEAMLEIEKLKMQLSLVATRSADAVEAKYKGKIDELMK